MTNCKVGSPVSFDDIEVSLSTEICIFDNAWNIKFTNVYITAREYTEVEFDYAEQFESWLNVRYDTFKIRVVLGDVEDRRFLEFIDNITDFYDVKGILEFGDHIVVDRGIYTHHGIYVGNNEIIHFSGEPGIEGIVTTTSLERLVGYDRFWVFEHSNSFIRREIVKSAKSMLGASDYNLVFNNCEHFATWCCTGEKSSNQVLLGPLLGKCINWGGAKVYRLKR